MSGDRNVVKKASSVSKRPRRVVTSLHGNGMHLCGLQPEPTEDRVSLRQNFHPGFGVLTLTRNKKPVWHAVKPEEARTLDWLERHLVGEKQGKWRLEVDGPMVSYTITRRAPSTWVLTESRDGFA